MKFKVITIENLSETLSDSSWTEGFDGGAFDPGQGCPYTRLLYIY